MLRLNKSWANNRPYLLLISVPSEDASYRLQSLLHLTQILRRHNWSATQLCQTTTHFRSNSKGAYHAVFRRSLPILGRTRLMMVLRAQPTIIPIWLCPESIRTQTGDRLTLIFATRPLLA